MITSHLPRVLMIVPQYPYPVVGGLEKQSHELSKALLKLGVPVQVLSGRIHPNQPRLEKVESVPVTRIAWSKWTLIRFLRTPIDILSVLLQKRGTYDLIHLHQHSLVSLFVIIAAQVLRKPVLTKLPNVGDYGIPGLRSKPLGMLRLAILMRSDGIIAMSEESIKELHSVGYPHRRILQVPNGIQMNARLPLAADHEGLPCRVVFVGRLSEEKHLETLLFAWQQVCAVVGDQVRLEIWGDGPLSGKLQELSRQLNLKGSVCFLGHVDNVRQRLPAADVFVLSSRVEGNSNAVLEAMEAGLPVVATSVGGTPMQVGVEGAPLLFEVGDSEALAERLLLLIQDIRLRRHCGEAMRRRIDTYFDINKVAVAYLSAYRELVESEPVNLTSCSHFPSP